MTNKVTKISLSEIRENIEKMQSRLNVAEQMEENIIRCMNWFMNYNSETETYEMPDEEDITYQSAVTADECKMVLLDALYKWVKS